jgi:hypothetical protein
MLNAHGAGGRTPGRRYYQARSEADHPHGEAYYGTNGTLIIDRLGFEVFPELNNPSGPGAVHPDQSASGSRMLPVEVVGEDATAIHVRNFIDCVRSRRQPAADIERGHRSSVVAHLGNIAYRTGHKIGWNSTQEQIVADLDASKLLRRQPRPPWDLIR